jgi:Flp pilus assembly pilin Flp
MRKFVRSLGARVAGDAGQGMAEYALLSGLIALVAVVAITLLGTNIQTTLNNIANQLISGS